MKRRFMAVLALILSAAMLSSCASADSKADISIAKPQILSEAGSTFGISHISQAYSSLIETYDDAANAKYAHHLTAKLSSFQSSDGNSDGTSDGNSGGSSYERTCAKYLLKQMKKIGLVQTGTISAGTNKASVAAFGKIPGKSSDHPIIFSGNYSLYAEGSAGDCSGVSCILAIARAMIDSGYEPEHDILFVCYGTAESDVSGTELTNLSENLNTELNTDDALVCFDLGQCDYLTEGETSETIPCIPDFSSFVNSFVDEYGEIIDNGAFSDGVSDQAEDLTDTDGIEAFFNCPFSKVAYISNMTGTQESNRSADDTSADSTAADDTSIACNDAVLEQNIRLFGAMGIVMDQNPALELNQTAMATWMNDTFNEEYAKAADFDSYEYISELDEYNTDMQKLYKDSAALDEAYTVAYSERDEDTMTKLRNEGAKLTSLSLSIYRISRDAFLDTSSSDEIMTKHESYNIMLDLLGNAYTACEQKTDWAEDGKSGVLDNLSHLDSNLVNDAVQAVTKDQDYSKAQKLIDQEYEEVLSDLGEALTEEETGLKSVLELYDAG